MRLPSYFIFGANFNWASDEGAGPGSIFDTDYLALLSKDIFNQNNYLFVDYFVFLPKPPTILNYPLTLDKGQ